MRPRDETERTLRDHLRPLRARRGVVLLALVLVPAGAVGASATQTASYEATARVFLGERNVPGSVGPRLQGTFKAPERAVRTQADRKSTRLNSSHANISYAVFCLKKKKYYS